MHKAGLKDINAICRINLTVEELVLKQLRAVNLNKSDAQKGWDGWQSGL